MGFKVYLQHLPGHAGEKSFSHLKAQHYFDAHKESYSYLKKKYQREVYFLGYSFGGLIGVDQFDDCPFEKMILLAPALKLHGYTLLLKPLLPFVKKSDLFDLATINSKNAIGIMIKEFHLKCILVSFKFMPNIR